jgi:hypothetical protein
MSDRQSLECTRPRRRGRGHSRKPGGLAALKLHERRTRLPELQSKNRRLVMAGISHASFQQKNYMMVYHILRGFFEQPAPVYRG